MPPREEEDDAGVGITDDDLDTMSNRPASSAEAAPPSVSAGPVRRDRERHRVVARRIVFCLSLGLGWGKAKKKKKKTKFLLLL